VDTAAGLSRRKRWLTLATVDDIGPGGQCKVMADETAPVAAAVVEQAFSEHWGRLLALLVRQLRSLDIAEESLAEAFELAVRHWPDSGVPDRPEAWLLTAARRRGLDRLRRDATLARKLPLLVVDADERSDDALGEEDGAAMSTIPDERLRLLFTCCHPALAVEARIALTLRMVGGLTTPEIAHAFLVSEPTMAARLTRAKKKIAGAAIPYRVPADAELPDRLGGVLAVLYLVFTEGHAATSGDALVRRHLCDEAIRLVRLLTRLLPDEPEPTALLALLLLQHSRRDTREDEAGRLVLLADQDRQRWDSGDISEGVELIHRAAAHGRVTPYLLQAAIAAEHATAATAEETDWVAIAALYERLEQLTGSPVVRLNRAVAVAETSGPAAGLALIDGLEDHLAQSHLLPTARADFLRRMGRAAEAGEEYARAIRLVGNATEREFLTRRLAELHQD
jgi:RNA polymerase sigma-70 factor, ECF subfamily